MYMLKIIFMTFTLMAIDYIEYSSNFIIFFLIQKKLKMLTCDTKDENYVLETMIIYFSKF